jgi:hypothetical protein
MSDQHADRHHWLQSEDGPEGGAGERQNVPHAWHFKASKLITSARTASSQIC